jgi:hypothetical protein
MMPNRLLQMLTGLNINGLKDAKTPDDLAQMLLNSGRVNQAQVNQAKQMWEQPNVRQMIQNKFPF